MLVRIFAKSKLAPANDSPAVYGRPGTWKALPHAHLGPNQCISSSGLMVVKVWRCWEYGFVGQRGGQD